MEAVPVPPVAHPHADESDALLSALLSHPVSVAKVQASSPVSAERGMQVPPVIPRWYPQTCSTPSQHQGVPIPSHSATPIKVPPASKS